MNENQQKQLSSCPQDRPICLNKPIKKSIEYNCTKIDEKYDPNKRINDIITCQTKTCSPDSYNKSNNTENCYSLTTAWLVIIGDLEKKIKDFMTIKSSNETINSKEVQQTIGELTTVSDVVEELENISESVNGIDLMVIFGSIKDYGMKKWSINDNQIDETSDEIDIVILSHFNLLIQSPGFKTFSEFLNKPSKLVELLSEIYSNNNNQENQEIIPQDKMFETIQKLFEITKYFMVEKRELINYKKDDIIQLFNSVITNLDKMFKINDNEIKPQSGGVEPPIRKLEKDKRRKLYTSLGNQLLNSSLRGTIDVMLLSFGSSIGLSSLVSVAAVVSAAIPFFNIAIAVIGVGLIISGAVIEYKKYLNSVTILEREIQELIMKYNTATDYKKRSKYEKDIKKFYEKYKHSYLNETKSLIKEIIKIKLSEYKEKEEEVKIYIKNKEEEEEEVVKKNIKNEDEEEEEENETPSLRIKIKNLQEELNTELKAAKKNAKQAAKDIINKNGQSSHNIPITENQNDTKKEEKSTIKLIDELIDELKKNKDPTNNEELEKIINLYNLQKFMVELNYIKSMIKEYTSKKYINEELQIIEDFFYKYKEFIPSEILNKYNKLYGEPTTVGDEKNIYEWNLVNPENPVDGGSKKLYKYKKRQCITRKKHNQQKRSFNKSKRTHIKKGYIKGHKYRTYYTRKNKKVCIKRTKKRKTTIYD